MDEDFNYLLNAINQTSENVNKIFEQEYVINLDLSAKIDVILQILIENGFTTPQQCQKMIDLRKEELDKLYKNADV